MGFRRNVMMLPTLLAGLLWAGSAGAQTPGGTIVGRVLDASTQSPLAGANIILNGTSRGTLSGADGRYLLQAVAAGTQRVRVNLIGYKDSEQTVNVTAGELVTVNFAVEPEAVALREIVAIGYGTTRKADLTGAVSSVKTEQLQKLAVASLQQGLQGTVAGVEVTQGDAAPGGGMRVQIRGLTSPNSDNQPLYVIDGVPVAFSTEGRTFGSRGNGGNLGSTEPSFNNMTSTNPLSTLAPSDIESIEVLKDASATAIYGSRGANGVVIVTTKKGRRGQPGQITLTYSQGFSSVVKQIDVLGAFDYATYINTAWKNYGQPWNAPFGGDSIHGSLTPAQLVQRYGPGINWQNQIFRTAPLRDLQMGFTGGDDQGNFALTGNLLTQDGVIKGSGFTRGGLRFNLDRQVKSAFRISSSFAVTRSKNNLVRSSTTEATTAQGIVRSAIRYSPLYYEAYDTTKLSTDARAENSTYFSRYGANPERYTDEVSEAETLTRGLGNVKAILTILPQLTFESSVGGNYERKAMNSYFPVTVAEGRNTHGLANVSGTEFVNILNENLLRFKPNLGDQHRVDAVGGFTYEWDRSLWNNLQAVNFPDDALKSNVVQNATGTPSIWSGIDYWKLASWLARANYAYRDRYLLTGTVRSDGASKFAENNKWATFYSFAAAWRAIEEPWFQQHFSDFKLRASVGQSGNQAIGTYQSLAQIAGTTTAIGGNLVPAAYFGRLANDNLKWETTTQYDGGLDLGMWQNRLTATMDVYNKNTDGLLQNVTLAPNTGYGSATINSGKVNNKGIELQAAYDVFRSEKGLNWNISATFSKNKNKIVDLGATKQQLSDRLGASGGLDKAYPFMQKPGLPIGAIWGYKTDGIFRTQAEVDAYKSVQPDAALGDYRYKDIGQLDSLGNFVATPDGHLTTSDQGVIGDVNPNFVYSINNRIQYRNFDLSALVTAKVGGDIVNASRMVYLTLNGDNGNIPVEYYKNAFDPVTNPTGKYPMMNRSRGGYGRFSDAFVENGSYVRIKNVQFGYTFHPRGVQSARAYVNAINLLTFTGYTGYDPEVSAFGSTAYQGVDLGSYPQSRMVSVGMSVTF